MKSRWLLLFSLLAALPVFVGAAAPAAPAWPSLDRQLSVDRVRAGSALDRLIRDNQDFGLLRGDEASDQRGLPPWLRVWWRKGNPEGEYTAADPTGGYPHVLKEIHEWMLSHQNLRPGKPGEPVPPGAIRTTVGADRRISGAQTTPRSESDIRVNFNATNQIVAASNNIVGVRPPGPVLLLQRRRDLGPDDASAHQHRQLPLRPRRRLDVATARAWSTTIGIKGNTLKVRAYLSTNGGATWTFDGTLSGTQKSADKQLMWVDHSASSPFKDNIYVCWHNGNPAYVSRRTAAGWQAAVQVSGAESTGTAIGCDIKTNSAGTSSRSGRRPATGASSSPSRPTAARPSPLRSSSPRPSTATTSACRRSTAAAP